MEVTQSQCSNRIYTILLLILNICMLLTCWDIPKIPGISKYFETKDNDTIQTPFAVFGNMTVAMNRKNRLSAPDCGRFRNSLIVNGETASEGAHPWMAAIVLRTGQFCCGATIINEWWVITAAHVFLDAKKGHGTDPDYFTLYVGSTDRMAGMRYEVQKVIPNSKFNQMGSKELDIALMKLKTPLAMGPNVGTVCLPRHSYDEPQGTVRVVGWGDTVYGSPNNKRSLQQVDLDIFPIEKCSQMYSKFNYKIFRSQFCTLNMNKDACQGDSGGPVTQIEQGRGILVGIVSYGYKCADDYPGVFTKVSHFINWIQTIVKSE